MVDTGLIENFLNEKSAKKGDIVEIADEGVIGEIAQQDGTKKKCLNLGISLNGRELIYTPGKTALRALQKVWGLDSKAWVGKKASVDFIKMNSFGELKNVLILMPITETKVK